MKKFSFLFTGLMLLAISNFYAVSQTSKQTKTVKKPVAATASSVDAAQGKVLITKSDCLTCHQEQVKVVGPSYISVAEKYPPTDANINLLADKIIKGGAGAWGPIPMTPHPTVTTIQAKKMVKYILTLKAK